MNIVEAINIYLELKPGKNWIKSIEPSFFFEFAETVITAYEKEKRLAEANLKDSEEFQDNMCNHRCILNSKVEELEAELEKEKEEHKKECHNCDEYTAKLGELETENRMLKSEIEKENFIHKDKIKAKLEEIDFMIKEINQGHLQKYTVGELLGAKRFLESLLEKE